MEMLRDETAEDVSANIEEMLELSRFTPYIGEKFDVSSLPQESLQLELVEAKALPGHAGAPYEDSFSLVFRAANDCTLGQGSVALEHEKVGWIVLFLVPSGEDQDGRYFEGVCN
jgi:hypothetical protein